MFFSTTDNLEHAKQHICIHLGVEPLKHSIFVKKVFDPDVMWEPFETFGMGSSLAKVGIDSSNILQVQPCFMPKQTMVEQQRKPKKFEPSNFDSLLDMVDSIVEPLDMEWPGKVYVGGHDALDFPQLTRRPRPTGAIRHDITTTTTTTTTTPQAAATPSASPQTPLAPPGPPQAAPESPLAVGPPPATPEAAPPATQ
eukprot:TRINITY_DN2608_c0_g3_i9.p1 TRINITY_DN2608_c0_g3~~TRINITY_DN2608_c0_g3_i9.p1  ORF type:complete len:197 (-),score=47.81 TRINITY_DN2608_c0_g3_i9:52-642(-)